MKLQALYSGDIYNMYGPTETTIWSTCLQIDRKGMLSIGKPIQNTQIYVVERGSDNPVPIGVVGELYIGGAGVARGYLNRPELTSKRFVHNPYASEKDKELGYTRLSRTGDLVRWLPDGNLEFIGRNDDQIKIRGYRIELGEIEHVLGELEGIKQSCVVAKERKTESGMTKYLVGYYIPEKKEGGITESAILGRLREVGSCIIACN